jgi:hypothetical protein
MLLYEEFSSRIQITCRYVGAGETLPHGELDRAAGTVELVAVDVGSVPVLAA